VIEPDSEPSIAFRVSAVPFLGERDRPGADPSERRSEITVKKNLDAQFTTLFGDLFAMSHSSHYYYGFYGSYVMGFLYRRIPFVCGQG
jgi:hypothetical protein